MEITVNIPKNDYVQPTEVRQEVVQAICEAFLNGKEFCTNKAGTGSTVYRNSNGKMTFIWDYATQQKLRERKERENDITYYIPHGCEVNYAFWCLYKAGYFIFKHEYGTNCYNLSKKPYYNGYKMVKEFTDFID